jgi:hypothetical protein
VIRVLSSQPTTPRNGKAGNFRLGFGSMWNLQPKERMETTERRSRSSSWLSPQDSGSIKGLESLTDPSGFEEYPEIEEKDEKRE